MSSKQNNFIPLFTKRLSAKMWIMGTMQPRIGNSLIVCWEGRAQCRRARHRDCQWPEESNDCGQNAARWRRPCTCPRGHTPFLSLSATKAPYTLDWKPECANTCGPHESAYLTERQKSRGPWRRSGLSLNSMTLRTVIISFLEITTLCVKYLRKFH